MAHPGNDRTPASYGSDHASSLFSRWNGPLGIYARQFGPQVFPGMPPEAIVGFTTIGGQTEDTCSVGNSFHEMGWFQTEGGPCGGPGPNPDIYASDNNWGRLASSDTVTGLLGRSATMVDGDWAQSPDDQVAVGLANLQMHAASVAAQIPAALAPSDPGSTWTAFLAFTGFSAGDGGAAHTINRYASQLASVPESGRVAALITAVLQDAQNGTLPGPTDGDHGNPAYDVLRTLQKFGSGRALAQLTGGNTSWFDLGFGSGQIAAEQSIDDAAYGRGVSSVPGFSAPSSSGSAMKAIGWLFVLAGVGALGYYGWNTYQHSRGRRSLPAGRSTSTRPRAARVA
jgi:hypothetical protein